LSRLNHVKIAAAALFLAGIGCMGGNAPIENESSMSTSPPTSGGPFDQLPPGDPASGEALFNGTQNTSSGGTLPCKACHTLDSVTLVGPSFQGLSERVPEGYASVQAYIYESITEPDAYIRDGFSPGIMPPSTAHLLNDQEMADLIAFLSGQ
jgi:hypothetical protein